MPQSQDRIRSFRLCDLRPESFEIFPADSARRKSGSTRIPSLEPAMCSRAALAVSREAKAGRRYDRAQRRKAKPHRWTILGLRPSVANPEMKIFGFEDRGSRLAVTIANRQR